MMKNLIEPFYDQLNMLVEEVKWKDSIVIGTLGPHGTSSHRAINFILPYFKNENMECDCSIKLQNNFNGVFHDLDKEHIDYALVPTAYERVTDFFWYDKFQNVLNFIYETPPYGLVCRGDFDHENPPETVRIATCRAVENMLDYFYFSPYRNCEVVEVSSTTQAVMALLENKADVCITNQTSYDLHKDQGIRFISEKFKADIVWSLFKKQ